MASVDASNEVTDDVSLLVLLIDCNPILWSFCSESIQGHGPINIKEFIHEVIVFINVFLSLHHLNRLAVIATGISTCQFIFQSSVKSNKIKSNRVEDELSESSVRHRILQNLTKFAEEEVSLLSKKKNSKKENEKENENENKLELSSSLLSAALSLSLTYIMRMNQQDPPKPKPRILCLHGSEDVPQQYISIMNAIFSAQRLFIPIDSCIFGDKDSAYLQQAAYLTKGIYFRPSDQQSFLQYLMSIFSVDLFSRNHLNLPKSWGVDFRASCFCHKQTVDMAFVCSVCLSIFCHSSKNCSTCGAEFVSKQAKQMAKNSSN